MILIIFFFLSLATLYTFIALGQRGGETFFSNLLLAIPGILAAILGTLSFVTGVVAVIKNKERSTLVYLATIIGLLVTLFWLGEIIFPH